MSTFGCIWGHRSWQSKIAPLRPPLPVIGDLGVGDLVEEADQAPDHAVPEAVGRRGEGVGDGRVGALVVGRPGAQFNAD